MVREIKSIKKLIQSILFKLLQTVSEGHFIHENKVFDTHLTLKMTAHVFLFMI